jgi:hypothetical protein
MKTTTEFNVRATPLERISRVGEKITNFSKNWTNSTEIFKTQKYKF